MAAAGGALIGLSAVGLLATNGRIAGISGILWGALSRQDPWAWRVLFITGLLAGGALAHAVAGVPLPVPSSLPTPMALCAGFLVGVGVKLGSGCTSGHGVCGMSLLSPRSFLATATFMSCGIAALFLVRHVFGVGS